MPALASLPSELLVNIICRIGVEEVLNLRLINKRIKDVIAVNLAKIGSASARVTFGNLVLLADPSPKPSHDNDEASKAPYYTISCFKNLPPKYLASTLLEGPLLGESRDYPPHVCLPAEDESGNDHRKHLEHGFKILRRLNLIAQDITENWDHTIEPKMPRAEPGQVWNHSLFGMEVTIGRKSSLEADVYHGWQDYLYDLKKDALVDYLLVRDLICVKVFCRHPRGNNVRGHYRDPREYQIGQKWCTAFKNTWDEWFLMHEGTELLLKQWSNRLPEDQPELADTIMPSLEQMRMDMKKGWATVKKSRREEFCQIIRSTMSEHRDYKGGPVHVPTIILHKIHDIIKAKRFQSLPIVATKNYYVIAERQFYNKAGTEATKRARYCCYQLKTWIGMFGDRQMCGGEMANRTWGWLKSGRQEKIEAKPPRAIELPRKKTGLLGDECRRAGFQSNENVPFFVFLDPRPEPDRTGLPNCPHYS